MEVYKLAQDIFATSITFVHDLATGDTLHSIVSCTALNLLTNLDATSVIIAASPAPAISGATVILTLKNGSAGGRFLINAVVNTTNSQTYAEQLYVFVLPSPLDLTTVDRVKSWAQITSDSADLTIATCITSASLYWMWRTGRVNGSTR